MPFHLRLADFLKSLITVGAEAQKILDMYNSMSETDRAANLSKFAIVEPTKCIGRPPTKLSSIVESVKAFPKSKDSAKIALPTKQSTPVVPNKQSTPVVPVAASSAGNQSDSNDDLFDENHTKAKSFLFQSWEKSEDIERGLLMRSHDMSVPSTLPCESESSAIQCAGASGSGQHFALAAHAASDENDCSICLLELDQGGVIHEHLCCGAKSHLLCLNKCLSSRNIANRCPRCQLEMSEEEVRAVVAKVKGKIVPRFIADDSDADGTGDENDHVSGDIDQESLRTMTHSSTIFSRLCNVDVDSQIRPILVKPPVERRSRRPTSSVKRLIEESEKFISTEVRRRKKLKR